MFRSWPHDFTPDLVTPQEVTEADFRFSLAAATQDGVDRGWGSALEASIQGQDIVLATGRGVVNGYSFVNETPVEVAVPANASALPRLYRVVSRLNVAASTVAPVVLEGTAASSPQLPALVRTETIYDLPLWACRRAGGGGPISQLVDHRVYLNPAGALACTSVSRPPDPVPGTMAYETDTGRLVYYHGGLWLTAADATYPTAWQPLQLRSGYVRHSIGYSPAWRYDAPGIVRLRGTITRASGQPLQTGEYIGVVPAAARPGAYTNLAVASHATRGHSTMRLEITSVTDPAAGRLVLWYSPTAYEPGWVSLDGLTYTL